MHHLTLIANTHHTTLDAELLEQLTSMTGAKRIEWLSDGKACDLCDVEMQDGLPDIIADALKGKAIDYCLQPAATRRKKLLISDMDSTIIQQECIDELAAMLGIKQQVAAITERAMQGELDFAASLRARVALLKGLPLARLEEVWQERIVFTEGAKALIATMKAHGATTLLVSGGFTFFTGKVAAHLGFDAHHANTLLLAGDALSGMVQEPILDHLSKQAILEQTIATEGLQREETLAVGDGANDAAMIRAAGLGVAYYAKPLLKEQADCAIDHTDLRSLLYIQGYHDAEIIES